MNSPPTVLASELSTVEVTKQVLADARELIALEVQLAREEVKEELRLAKQAAIAGAAAACVLLLSLCAAIVALILALGGEPAHALVVALTLLVVALAAGAYAYAAVPKQPMERTKNRLAEDAKRLKEHVV